MSKGSLWYHFTISLVALYCTRQDLCYALKNGVTFRAKTSYIEYNFTTTSAFPGGIFRLEFSSTSCKGDLIIVTSRDTDNYFKIYLEEEEEEKINFYYKHEAGDFNLGISLPHNKTFCDGQRHSIEVKRYGKMVTYSADGREEMQTEVTNLKIAIFSKPDKISLGGSNNKFDGCVFSALVLFHWKTDLSKNVSVNIIERYLKRDPRVHSAAVFPGACPNSESPAKGDYELRECTRSSTDISMTTGRGVIASPQLQESNHISRCLWRITAPDEHRLKFTLLFYNVSGFVSCSKSEVIVYDGISSASNVLERFCFAKSNTVVYTRGRQMMVGMTLPENIYLDFIGVYEVVKMDEGPCPTNRTLTDMSGILTSPDFPLNYGFEHKCSWIILVPIGYHILLSFDMDDFNIHPCHNQSCACDFLEVRAGTTSKGKFIGDFCGATPPSPIYVSGRESWLRFVTNKDNANNKGFRATYKAIRSLADECPRNRTFTDRRGYVHSPRFALDYPGDMECVWRIRVSKENRVSFVFLTPINLDPNCTDFLEVRDGLDVTSPLLDRYCGFTKAPPNIFSSGREMFVRFKSDSYLRGLDGSSPGFQATYFATRVKSGAAFFKTSLSLITLLVILFNYC